MPVYPYRSAILPLLLIIISVLALSAGCTTTNIGDVSYAGKNLTATISSDGPFSNATYIQVTVYRTTGLSQQEYTVTSTPVSLVKGMNTVTIPVALEPGSYKLNVYLIRNGQRSSAVIRDIGVP